MADFRRVIALLAVPAVSALCACFVTGCSFDLDEFQSSALTAHDAEPDALGADGSTPDTMAMAIDSAPEDDAVVTVDSATTDTATQDAGGEDTAVTPDAIAADTELTDTGCMSPLTVCGSVCVDTRKDPGNCGGCNIKCGVGQSCKSKHCN